MRDVLEAASSRERVDILGVGVDVLTVDTALDVVASWIVGAEPNYVCVAGVHGVMASQEDAELAAIHRRAGLVTADGMPLVWLSRRRGAPDAERVYGPDLMLAAFARSQVTGWRHFLYGTDRPTLARLERNLGRLFPGVAIVGSHSPPFGDPAPAEERDAVERIAGSGADIVWVGLSTPRQERWMAAHVGRVGAPVLVGVGAAFDFHAGVKRQAPRWLQRAGGEWAFRLVCEPARLAPRYLRNNPRFVAGIAAESLARWAGTWPADRTQAVGG